MTSNAVKLRHVGCMQVATSWVKVWVKVRVRVRVRVRVSVRVRVRVKRTFGLGSCHRDNV